MLFIVDGNCQINKNINNFESFFWLSWNKNHGVSEPKFLMSFGGFNIVENKFSYSSSYCYHRINLLMYGVARKNGL